MALLTLDTLWNDKMLAKTDSQSRAKVRSNPVPIDYSSIFKSKSDAVTYAANDPTAYPGQIIAVAENEFSEWACETDTPSFTIEGTTVKFSNGVTKTAVASADEADQAGEEGAKESLKLTLTVKEGDLAVPAQPGTGEDVELTFTRTYGQTQNVYVIDGNAVNNLKKISGGAGTGSAGSGDVEAETARAMAAEQALSGAIDTKTVTVEKLMTAEDGFLATYIVKQNGEQVGESINIPKDFLVKSATVKTCGTEDQPVEGLMPGDKYIDFAVNSYDAADDAEPTKHLYIPFKELLKPYTFLSSDTIEFTVDADNNVSADVIDGSIVTDKLDDKAVTTAKIADKAVGTDQLDDKAVTTAKIDDKAVGTDQLADDAVTEDKIADDAVTGDKIAENAISAEHIADKAVGTDQLADDAVTCDKIADGAVGTDQLSEELQTVLTSLEALEGANLAHDTDASATYVVTEGEDGKLVASQKAIEIAQSQITDLSGKTLVDTGMVAEADEEADEDLIARESTVDSKIEEALTVLSDYVKAEDLDDELTSALEDYVLTSDVVEAADENDKIVRQSTLENEMAVLSDYLTTADFNTISTTIGLDAASETNKVATLSDLTALDVEGTIDEKLGQLTVEIDAGKTITAIKQDDEGKITVETADIEIEQSAVNGLEDALQALSDLVDGLDEGLSDYVTVANFDTSADTIGMKRASADDKLVISSDVSAAIDKALEDYVLTSVAEEATAEDKLVKASTVDSKIEDAMSVLSDYVPTSAVSDFSKVSEDDKIVLSSDVSAAIEEAITGIGDVLHFKGVVDIPNVLSDWTAPDDTAKGDIYLDSDTAKEYVVVEAGEGAFELREIGDEKVIDQYVAKTTKVNGKELTGDVTLDGGDIDVGGEGTYKDSTVEAAITGIDERLTALEDVDMDDYLLTADANTLSTALSTAIQNKVKVGDYGEELTAVDELSVVRIDGETYHDLVKNDKTDPNTVYIVSADEANMYGERVTNVADAVEDTDAVTFGQAKQLAQDAQLTAIELNGLAFDIADNKASLSVEIIDCGGAEA